jgi:voltage-gated potassium channel
LSAIQRLVIAIGILLLIVAIGTLGFTRLEGLSAFEALYLTVVSITTVGYGDIVAVTTGGRILAMCLIVTGFTFFTTVVVTAVQFLFERREATRRSQQLYTLITLFFSEVGDRLIRLLSGCDPDLPCIQEPAPPEKVWTAEDYYQLASVLKNHSFVVDLRRLNENDLRKLLDSPLLLSLLENPLVFNHELFNRLLREMFHIKGELAAHKGFSGLPDKLLAHLGNDISKVYQPAVKLWLENMRYLETAYPSLFMTVMETNPFGIAKPERSCPLPPAV